MWLKTEDDMQIDIQPRGEEDRHIASSECECLPTLGRSDTRKLMVIHKTFDGMQGFEPVAGCPLPVVSQRRAA